VCNIFSLHRHFSNTDTINEIDTECRRAGIGCIDCKLKLSANMSCALEPIRARHAELIASPDIVSAALEKGASRCRAIAGETMEQVRRAIGVR
ncbi:MAG: tryptophan--tRNA ligase, partial [Fibrobacteres bacterium]|nr:tryptophan--tRNA ligase [Fibrobacterota bacterium]